MKIDQDARVRARLADGFELQRQRRKVHQMRRLVAGDFSQVLGTPGATNEGPENQIKIDELFDFIVTTYDGEHSNRMLEAVKQVTMRVGFSVPEIEFEDLSSEEAAVNAGWAKQRLADPPIGCGARDEMRMGLLDYAIGGLGWSFTTMRQGIPVIRNCDSLDMSYDRAARIPSRIRWASCRYREPLAYWVSEFGAKPFEDLIAGADNNPGALDELVELEYYYDTDSGPNGSFYVYRRSSGEVTGDPVHRQDNPYYFDVAGVRVPFLPYTPIYFMALPSLRYPVSMVEMLFPDQMALWRIEESNAANMERGRAFYQSLEGNLSDDARKQFERGEINALIEFKKSPITRTDAQQMDSQSGQQISYHERRFTAMAGLNPYASGAPIEGVDFASEVQAISGQSDLSIGYIGKDHAAWWTSTARKFLAVGSLYDDNPISVRIGGVPIKFDQARPIKMFLRPDADLVIREDSTMFQSRQQAIAKARVDLESAMAVSQAFPAAVGQAYEKYLRVSGEKNIAAYLAQPQASPGAAPASPEAQAQSASI